MLKRQTSAAPIAFSEPRSNDVDIGLRDILAFLKRRRAVISLVTGLTLFIGCLYLLLTPLEYSATALLLIDTRKIEIFGKGDVSADANITNAAVETEVLILKSTRVAEGVIRELRLIEDPVFMSGRNDLFSEIKGSILGFVTGMFVYVQPERSSGSSEHSSLDSVHSSQPSMNGPILRAVNLLKKDVAVARQGLTYAISVGCTSGDPVRAARIANAVVDAYLKDQVNRQVSTAARLSEWLRARLDELRGQGFEANLTAEEKSAYRGLYDTFLQRYTEAVQQQSLPVAQAQILSSATPPSAQSSPSILLVLASSLGVGMALGGGIAFAHDLLDRRIRSRHQLESATRISCLGFLPAFRARGGAFRRTKRPRIPLETDKTFAVAPQYSIALSAPFSLFSETLRNIKLVADTAADGPVVVLGVTSSVQNEGKTTVAINLARLFAGETAIKVLLIDADLKNPSLTRDLVPAGTPGLLQVVANGTSLSDVMWFDRDTKLQLLPSGVDTKLINSSEVLGSERMKFVMNEVRQKYSFIIVDLPPLLPVVDVRAAAHLVDGFAFIVEWGKLTDDAVTQAFDGIQDRVIGTVLNKVPMSRLHLFERHPVRAMDRYLESYRHVT